jgi:hypothetical protein
MSPGIDGHQDSSTHQSRPSTGRLRPCACGSALSCRVCSPAGPRRSLLSPLEERETTVRRSPHSLDTGGVTDTHTRWLCRSTDRPWGWLNRTSLFYWKKKKPTGESRDYYGYYLIHSAKHHQAVDVQWANWSFKKWSHLHSPEVRQLVELEVVVLVPNVWISKCARCNGPQAWFMFSELGGHCICSTGGL